MNRFTTTALMLALLATAASARAQDGRWSNGDPRNSGHARAGAMVNQRPEPQAQAAPDQGQPQERRWDGERRGRGGGDQAPPAAAGGAYQAQPGVSDGQRNWQGRRDGGDRNGQGRQDGQRNWGERGDRNEGGDRNWGRGGGDRNAGGWNPGRNWERDRPRYDRRAYPPVYRTHQRYRAPAYRAPRGFYARSWVFGDVVPRGWYGDDYRIYDWFDYGLPIPPVGYDWVRVGEDAVLIDTFTGRVVQVVYGLFW